MKKRGHLVSRIMFIATIVAAIGGVVLTFFGIKEVRNTYLDMTKEVLHTAVSQADSEFSKMADGDWSWDGTTIKKGDEEVYDKYLETMEELKKQTGLDYTIFYNDTRVITTLRKGGTGDYLINTQASPEVTNSVVNNKESVYKPGIVIEGVPFYGYYMPMYNTDGTSVGMMFTGRQSAQITGAIRKITIIMIFVCILIVVTITGLGIFFSATASKSMNAISEAVETVAEGKLFTAVPQELLDRDDELGTVAESVENLRERLCEVIGTTMDISGDVTKSGGELAGSADQASRVSGNVTYAIEDITNGATSQAQNVQTSADTTERIGQNIDGISKSIEALSKETDDMQHKVSGAMEVLAILLDQNGHVSSSMGEIDSQVRATNDAVGEIASASQAIADISRQTNLLSLNASIEAARAGEAGKGFAVVADEIRQLADQSNEAASRIDGIIGELVEKSRKSIEVLTDLGEAVSAQSDQIDKTRSDMEAVANGASAVAENAASIREEVEGLSDARDTLTSIIDNLSAVSQENAASTEETNASMEELNGTFAVISGQADELKDLATKLNDEISYFSLDS